MLVYRHRTITVHREKLLHTKSYNVKVIKQNSTIAFAMELHILNKSSAVTQILMSACQDVIKLEDSLQLRIKYTDWLLVDTQAANHCALF